MKCSCAQQALIRVDVNSDGKWEIKLCNKVRESSFRKARLRKLSKFCLSTNTLDKSCKTKSMNDKQRELRTKTSISAEKTENCQIGKMGVVWNE